MVVDDSLIVDNQKIEGIGARLKAARKALGFTQEDLAKAVGRSRRGIQENEAHDVVPGGDVIAKLAVLGIDGNWLISGEGTMLISDALQYTQHQSQGMSGIADSAQDGMSTAAQYSQAAASAFVPDSDGVTSMVTRCILAAESVAAARLDRQQLVSLGLDTWGALSRIMGGPDAAKSIGPISDDDLALLARFVLNTKAALMRR